MKKVVLVCAFLIWVFVFMGNVNATFQTWSADCESGYYGGNAPRIVRYGSSSSSNGYDVCEGSKNCVSAWDNSLGPVTCGSVGPRSYCCVAGGGTATCGSGKTMETWRKDCESGCWQGISGVIRYSSSNANGYDVCGGSDKCMSGWTSAEGGHTVGCGSIGSIYSFCCKCTDTTWMPEPSSVCSGVTFTQTSNCGRTRQSTGTANCNCTGVEPTGAGVIKGPSNFTTQGYSYTPKTWTYDNTASTSTPCKWKCDIGYQQSGNLAQCQGVLAGCSSKITKNTILTNDLLNCPGNGLEISADNVILDCQNHKITGSGASLAIGINVTGRRNVTIKNCEIQNFSIGIYLENSKLSKIESNNANNNGNAILILRGENNTISSNTLENNKFYGILMRNYSYNNLVESNIIEFNRYYEIYVAYHSYYNIFRANTLKGGIAGIWFADNSSYNSIYDNRIINNTNGIVFQATALRNNNNIVYNNFFNNTQNAVGYGINYFNITKTFGTNIIGGPWIGGNYWSDYTGADTDGDGIGDTNLPYNSSNNISVGGDWLPLTTRGAPPTPPTANCTWPVQIVCSEYNDDVSCFSSGNGTCCTWNFAKICKPVPGSGAWYCIKDGIVDFDKGEECDPGNATVPQNLSGKTCLSEGYKAGTLSCTQFCTLNYDLCTSDCILNASGSFWADTGKSSASDCKRKIDNVWKTCCVSGKSCVEVDNNWRCVMTGIQRCSDYTSRTECNNFDSWIAEADVEAIKGNTAFCGSQSNSGIYECVCSWNSTLGKCQPKWNILSITNRDIVLGSCSYSVSEGECDETGFKQITYTASGTADGCSGSSSVSVPCFAATEMPFWSVWGVLIFVGLVVGFYLIRKR